MLCFADWSTVGAAASQLLLLPLLPLLSRAGQ
jgi:hypothetical protein